MSVPDIYMGLPILSAVTMAASIKVQPSLFAVLPLPAFLPLFGTHLPLFCSVCVCVTAVG
jgi:hypothetical protein